MSQDIYLSMIEKWPSAVVARTHIEEFTGGLISPKYIANLDCIGEGPPRVLFGRKVGYPVEGLVAWLRKRSEYLNR